jgi:hypothetical protein
MEWIRQLGRFVVVVVLQVLLFDRLQIGSWGLPMVYILFLMNLPIQIPRWLEMLIGASVGLLFDIWNSCIGVNMAACIAFSFFRPILLDNLVQDIERIKGEICSRSIGKIEYIKCLSILTFAHHFLVFSLEAWSMQNFWIILAQTIVSSILSIVTIVVYDTFK